MPRFHKVSVENLELLLLQSIRLAIYFIVYFQSDWTELDFDSEHLWKIDEIPLPNIFMALPDIYIGEDVHEEARIPPLGEDMPPAAADMVAVEKSELTEETKDMEEVEIDEKMLEEMDNPVMATSTVPTLTTTASALASMTPEERLNVTMSPTKKASKPKTKKKHSQKEKASSHGHGSSTATTTAASVVNVDEEHDTEGEVKMVVSRAGYHDHESKVGDSRVEADPLLL